MCIAIVQKNKDAVIPKAHLVNGFDNNDDGAGYAFIKNGKVKIRKGFFKFDKFYQSYRNDLAQYGGNPFLIHFRISTGGNINVANSHPFRLSDGLAMIHNGVLSPNVAQPCNNYSDTYHFCKQFLQPYLGQQQHVPTKAEIDAIGGIIGSGNKVAFLAADGTFAIANERVGHWNKAKNVWYSNTSYERSLYNRVHNYGRQWADSWEDRTYDNRTVIPINRDFGIGGDTTYGEYQARNAEPEEVEIAMCAECNSVLEYATEISLDLCLSCIQYAEKQIVQEMSAGINKLIKES